MAKTARKPVGPIEPIVLINDGTFVTCKEAAHRLKLSEITIRRLLTQRKLKRYKAGTRTLIRATELAGFVREAK